MKKRIMLIICLLAVCTIGFDYDPNLAEYKVMGTVYTIPNESWHCTFNWSGGENQDIVIIPEGMPKGMYADANDWTFGWTAEPNQVGTHYINFSIGKHPDPNNPSLVWISDKCTIVVRVEDWQDPPQWLPMCGGK